MKFIHYVEKVSGIDIFGLVSLGIFFLFFLVMLTWVFKTQKKSLEHLRKRIVELTPINRNLF